MLTTLIIQENETKRWAQVTIDLGDDLEGVEFQLTEGNYACDCNRELLFRRARGERDPVETGGCGDTRYSLVSFSYPSQTSPEATPPHEAPSEHPQPSHTEPPPESPGEASDPSGATPGPRPPG